MLAYGITDQGRPGLRSPWPTLNSLGFCTPCELPGRPPHGGSGPPSGGSRSPPWAPDLGGPGGLSGVARRGYRQDSRGPKKGQKLPFFGPLRRKVQGEWGGSAHSPDPTAQSVLRRRRGAARPRAPVRPSVGGPGGSGGGSGGVLWQLRPPSRRWGRAFRVGDPRGAGGGPSCPEQWSDDGHVLLFPKSWARAARHFEDVQSNGRSLRYSCSLVAALEITPFTVLLARTCRSLLWGRFVTSSRVPPTL